LYQNLGGGVESVHLLDWPTNYTVDEAVLSDMERVRSYINEGLSIRAREGLKVRQPLASVRVPGQGITFDFAPILTEELNVKAVEYGEEVALDTELTPELKREGMAREVIRHVQSARKVVGLQVDDRIGLTLATDNEELKKAIEEFRTIIETETLAHRDSHTRTVGENDFHTEVKVDGSMLSISLAKEENA
jgi:isoleucyl-tRNA synthetase